MLRVVLLVASFSPFLASNVLASRGHGGGSPSSLVCNSLSGPFCVHLGADAVYRPYMTPIEPPSDNSDSVTEADAASLQLTKKKCFFQHFAKSWMDAGGDFNDLMSQQVDTIEECEQLCCDHPNCHSYTFWMGNTCFLRATKNMPRYESKSFSANKLQ